MQLTHKVKTVDGHVQMNEEARKRLLLRTKQSRFLGSPPRHTSAPRKHSKCQAAIIDGCIARLYSQVIQTDEWITCNSFRKSHSGIVEFIHCFLIRTIMSATKS